MPYPVSGALHEFSECNVKAKLIPRCGISGAWGAETIYSLGKIKNCAKDGVTLKERKLLDTGRYGVSP